MFGRLLVSTSHRRSVLTENRALATVTAPPGTASVSNRLSPAVPYKTFKDGFCWSRREPASHATASRLNNLKLVRDRPHGERGAGRICHKLGGARGAGTGRASSTGLWRLRLLPAPKGGGGAGPAPGRGGGGGARGPARPAGGEVPQGGGVSRGARADGAHDRAAMRCGGAEGSAGRRPAGEQGRSAAVSSARAGRGALRGAVPGPPAGQRRGCGELREGGHRAVGPRCWGRRPGNSRERVTEGAPPPDLD